jgi:hypothetical protein
LEVVFDDRVAASETLLMTETLVDPLGGVPLFFVNAFIFLQDGINKVFVRIQLGGARID